tara:strand:- start:150 stop:413 length:264 start_codon:yes stop_codon:yes gene_type:complete
VQYIYTEGPPVERQPPTPYPSLFIISHFNTLVKFYFTLIDIDCTASRNILDDPNLPPALVSLVNAVVPTGLSAKGTIIILDTERSIN